MSRLAIGSFFRNELLLGLVCVVAALLLMDAVPGAYQLWRLTPRQAAPPSQRLTAPTRLDALQAKSDGSGSNPTDRRQVLALTLSGALMGRSALATAQDATLASLDPSAAATRPALSMDELVATVRADLVERQFLATADITRAIYSDRCTFTDEIDTYPIDQWVKGTKQLFVSEGSQVDLVGDVLPTADGVAFRFSETLMFRIPFRPVVTLTGRVELRRDPTTGLITSYREFWDQSIPEVLLGAKF